MVGSNYKAHVFVCTNQKKEGKECCANKGGQAFRDSLKDMAKKLFDKQDVRINASGCLDQCKDGIAVVIYPQNKWLLNLEPGDESKVLDEVQKILG